MNNYRENRGVTAILLVLAFSGLLLLGCTSQAQGPPNSIPTRQPNSSQGMGATPPSAVGTQFSSWKYYPMAHQIAPGPISSDAQAALNVFSVQQTQQADGSLLVIVNDIADNTQSNFTVSPGETLYFADGNPGDDVGNESDGTLVDDHFVLVDSNNTIVEMLSSP